MRSIRHISRSTSIHMQIDFEFVMMNNNTKWMNNKVVKYVIIMDEWIENDAARCVSIFRSREFREFRNRIVFRT